MVNLVYIEMYDLRQMMTNILAPFYLNTSFHVSASIEIALVILQLFRQLTTAANTTAYRPPEMTTPDAEYQNQPPAMPSESIQVHSSPEEEPPQPALVAPSEGGSDAPRKHKRRSGNSVDLTYRYNEPSDDELSWTEDEHGTRRRRKSRRKSGTGDDFKTGIMFLVTSVCQG